MSTVNSKTKRDVGEKPLQYSSNTGYWASLEYLQDIFGPLYDIAALQDKYVAEIGSRTGRVVNRLLDAGVSRVVAIEPGKSFPVLLANVRPRSNRVVAVHAEGEIIREYVNLDLICSISIPHAAADPDRIVAASFAALKPGGKMLVTLYAAEGSSVLLSLLAPLRKAGARMTSTKLDTLASLLVPPVIAYKTLCRMLPLPLKAYMVNYMDKLESAQIKQTLFDSLEKPHIRLYRKEEAIALLEKNGFVNVQCHFRHDYSWAVIGERPFERKTIARW